MNLQSARLVQSNTESEAVECDVCTGKKNKAVKSCLKCLKSYCQNHLRLHEMFFQSNKHSLINPTRQLNETICSKHRRHLEIFCRTDQQCICCLCLTEEHTNHEIVAAEAERTEKQRHLRETQRNVQQRIQEREKELLELRKVAESYKHSAQTAVEDSERIFIELIRSIERHRSEVTKLIRAQEQAAVSQAESLWQQLHQEIVDLKRRNTELEQLSHTDNLIQFLQSFQSVSAALESPVSHNITVSPLLSFDDVRKSVSQLKEKLENFFKEETERISDRVTHIIFIRPNEPKTRKEFLQYFRQFTLDSNTVNRCLLLSDGDRKATDTNIHQQYPDHPERFEYCAQVLGKESVNGCCYWEVEWSGNAGVYISVAYKTISRKSNEDESSFERSNQSWGVYCRPSSISPLSIQPSLLNFKLPVMLANVNTGFDTNLFQALVSQPTWTGGQSISVRNSTSADFPVSSSSSRIGVYVDQRAETLSFYSISDTMTLIHSIQTTFSQPLYPGFTVYKGSTVTLYNPTK
ncbi:tripartite motif-containing protein 16-like isoform X2 [Triplophysa dalaica]|nr:tripartite motif-containing protein 16-like isoform X2 [Triplophysa dalaica]